jgi:hypothetical protein
MNLQELKARFNKTDKLIGKNVTVKHMCLLSALSTALAYFQFSLENTLWYAFFTAVVTFIYARELDKDKKQVNTET